MRFAGARLAIKLRLHVCGGELRNRTPGFRSIRLRTGPRTMQDNSPYAGRSPTIELQRCYAAPAGIEPATSPLVRPEGTAPSPLGFQASVHLLTPKTDV